MNIFYLHPDLDTNAHMHFDKHIVKMPLEAAQMLCANLVIDDIFGFVPRKLTSMEFKVIQLKHQEWRQLPQEARPVPYLPMAINHPCTIWARTTLANYYWTVEYALALGKEYTFRYGKEHKATTVVKNLREPKHLKGLELTPRPQAMPEDYKNPDDPIDAYRAYYYCDKKHLASWKDREVPEWWL